MEWIKCMEMYHEKSKILPQWAVEQLLKGINIISIITFADFFFFFFTVTALLEVIWYFIVIVSGFLKVDVSVS